MKTEAELVAELMQRPAAERARIAAALQRSLDEDDDDEDDHAEAVEAAWDDELKRRMAEIDNGEVELISLEEFEENCRAWRAARAAAGTKAG